MSTRRKVRFSLQSGLLRSPRMLLPLIVGVASAALMVAALICAAVRVWRLSEEGRAMEE